MIVLLAAPVVVALVTYALAERVAPRLRPATAARVLTGLGLSISLGVGLMLSLVAYIGIGDFVPALQPTDWSHAQVRDRLHVSPPIGLLAALLVVALLVRAGAHVWRTIRSLRAASTVIGSTRDHAGVVILAEDSVVAYAQPRWGGRGIVVVSQGLLRVLTSAERRALLAHEQAHLDHHHHRYVWAARLAAAANPLVTPLARAVDVAVEKWADAESVRAVGDPGIVARAIGKAALAGSGQPRVALGAGSAAVVERVRVLLDPLPGRSRTGGMWLGAAMTLSWVSVVAALVHVHGLIEAIEAANL